MGQVVGGSRLRARLLVGVATVALAAPASHRALAQQAGDKYQAHLEAGGLITNDYSGGDVDLFLPLWQDPTSLLYGDLRGTFTGQPAQSGSFGLGYRTQVDPEWILGGYGFFDLKHTDDDNTFLQGSIGLEALSVDWDFRVNGYFPFNSDSGSKSEQGTGGLGGSGLTIIGTDIGFHTTTEQEKALFGVDGEVGWRVPIFPADGDVDVRVFAGGFYFSASDVDALAGPRGRIEVRLYDLDFLGVQSRLTAQGLVQWDAERGTIGGGGLELRIPLGGFFGDPETKLSALDRRMVDRVVRNPDVIQTATAKTDDTRLQDVIVDGLTVSTHKIVFADGTGTAGASGTQANPTDLNSAPGKFPGQNEIIVAQGNNGPLNVNNPVQLQDGQALLGGGTPVGVTLVGGPNSGRHLYFTPPGTRPTVVGNNAGLNLIQMASGSQNRVTGLDLAGGFSNGIAGENMYRAVVTDNFVSGGAGNGVFLRQSGAGAQPSSYVYVARNTVAGNALNGILVENDLADGQGHTQAAWIADNAASGNGGIGIAAVNQASGAGTRLDQNLYIQFNSAVGNGDDGIFAANRASGGAAIAQFAALALNDAESNAGNGIWLANQATGAGSSVDQYTVVALNLAQSNSLSGIRLENAATSGGTIGQTANVGLVNAYGTFGNTVTGNGSDGIVAVNGATGTGASVRQSLAVVANLATGNGTGAGGPLGFYRNGIEIGNFGTAGGAVSQSLAVAGNEASGNSNNGIALWNHVEQGSSVEQAGDLSGNFASANARHGFYLYNRAGTTAAVGVAGGSIVQSLTGTADVATGNAFDGLRLANVGLFSGSAISQSVALTDATITGNGFDGLALANEATSGAVISQGVSIDPTTITGNGRSGIYGSNGITSATLFQTVAVSDSTVSYNGSDGIRLLTSSAAAASVTTRLTLDNSLVNGNSGNGIFVAANGLSGTVLSQSTHVHSSDVNGNGRAGIGVYARASSGATATQNVTLGKDGISGNGFNGIRIGGAAQSGSQLVQSAGIYFNNVVSNGTNREGIVVLAGAIDGSGLIQTANINNNSVIGHGDTGIYVRANGSGGVTGFTQSVSIGSNFVSQASNIGIYVGTTLTSAAVIGTAAVKIESNQISGVGLDGIRVRNRATSATIIETSFDIAANTITSVGGRGIQLRNDIGSSGALTQIGAILGNSISEASSSGILLGNGVRDAGASLTQGLSIVANSITGNGRNGIYVNNGFTSATVSQSLGIVNNLISDNGRDGIRDITTSAVASTFSQGLSIGGNTIVDNSDNGIFVSTTMFSNSVLTQTASLTDNTVANGGSEGIDIFGNLSAGGTVVQSVTATGNTVQNFDYDGIFVRARLYGSGGATQTVSLGANTLQGIGGDGIKVVARESGGTALSQSVAITGNSLASIGSQGIYVGLGEIGGSSFGQAVTITNNTATDIGSTGIRVRTQIDGLVSAGTMAVAVDGNALTSIAGNGIQVYARMSSATIAETLSIDENSVVHATGIGIYLHNIVAFGAVLTQGVSGSAATIDDNFVSDTGSAGILAFNEVSGVGATLSQVLTIDPNTVLQARDAGIAVWTNAYRGGLAVQTLGIDGNTVALVQPLLVDAVGIGVRNTAGQGSSSGTISQTLAITGNSVATIGPLGGGLRGDGIGLLNDARSGSLISQAVTVATNTISGVDGVVSAFGVDNLNFAKTSGATITQALSITGNSVSGIYGKGFVVGVGTYNAVTRGGSVSQSLVIATNTISDVGGSSAALAVGILEQNGVRNGSTLSVGNSVLSNSVTGVTGAGAVAGFALYNKVGQGVSLSQTVTLAGNQLSSIATLNTGPSAGAAGIALITYVDGSPASTGAATQTFLLSGNGVSQISGPNASAAGILVLNGAQDGSASQALTLLSNSVANLSGDGIVLANVGGPGGTIVQTLALGSSGAGNIVSAAGRDGIVLANVAAGGLVGQSGGVIGNQSLYNKGTGLVVTLDALAGAGPASVGQLLSVNGNRLNGNGVGVGFAVSAADGGNYAAGGAWLMQGNTIQHNLGAGSFGVQGSSAGQAVVMTGGGNTITSNGLLRFVIYANEGVQALALGNGTSGNVMTGANLVTAVGGALQVVIP